MLKYKKKINAMSQFLKEKGFLTTIISNDNGKGSKPIVAKKINVSNNGRVIDQVKVVQGLNSTYIVRTTTTELKNKLYLVYDRLDGDVIDLLTGNLDVQLRKNDFYIIILSILFGLRDLHSAEYVHGDIKPDNILVTIREKKLSSVVIGDIDGISRIGSRNLITFTRAYAAPEVKKHKYGYCKKSDVYSLGKTIKLILKHPKFIRMNPLHSEFIKAMLRKKSKFRPKINTCIFYFVLSLRGQHQKALDLLIWKH